MMKPVLLFLVIFLIASYLEASEPAFTPKDLINNDQLIFSCETEQPGWGLFQTVLKADLSQLNDTNNKAVRVLTHFPEQTAYYAGTQELEILNRFGLFRIKLDGDTGLHRLDAYPSYRQGNSIPKGRILPTAASPDGQWVLIQEAADGMRGNLYLYEVLSNRKFLISSDHFLMFQPEFALWSENSDYVVYSRNNRLYYMAVNFTEDAHIPDESHRDFGKGRLTNLRWADGDTLYYLSNSLVTLIRPSELFTRTFYSNPLPAGETVGRIPIGFDPSFDRFWLSPDGRALMLLKGGQNLFLIPLEVDGAENKGTSLSLPYLLLPKKMKLLQFWWRNNGDTIVLAGGSRHDGSLSLLYQMNAGGEKRFKLQNLIDIRRFVPSPDGTILAVLEDGGVSMRNVDGFEEIKYINHPDPRELQWVDMDKVLISGGYRIESVLWKSDERHLITISTADEVGADPAGNIVGISDGRHYQWRDETSTWLEINAETDKNIGTPRLDSKLYRVYEKVLSSSVYANQIMVRSISGFGNRALLNVPEVSQSVPGDFNDDAFQSAFDERVFDHGSRVRQREIALVFNAVDSDEGIGEVLNVLDDYGIRATFFLGGDFIRRNRESTRTLASTNHEIGSLFYTHMDMADYRYRINKNFIIRGLGRNEDEYFRVTGKELSTLWHSPWYVVSPPVLDATQSMNYLYVGRDVDPLDWVTFDSPESTRNLYRSSLHLVERILKEVKPGSIVPIRLGKPGNREDYLFNEIELLINGLLRDGYDIVTAGELKEHSL